MTIRRLEKDFIDQLTQLYNFEEARNLAWLSIGFVCRLNRMEYLDAKQDELSADQETSLLSILNDLKTGKPLQYILGETDFYGLTFKVNPAVLIPRPETEELVDWIIKDIRKEGGKINTQQFSILDIGTGSGCIPVSLKKNLPEVLLFSMDVSPDALETAIKNSILNETEVTFYLDDILHPTLPEVINLKLDIIVSNPPYVTNAEKGQMHSNVLVYEPHTALFVDDDDPLLFYRAIAIAAIKQLKEKGLLYLEINESLGTETVDLLRNYGFDDIELRTDLSGRFRMIKAHRPAQNGTS
jgi:release factor glutamine methyltransferase